MKKIKIFAMSSHTFVDRVSGVDYLRIIQPMSHLKDYIDDEYKFDVHAYDATKGQSFDWREIFAEYDIIYFNYTTNAIGYAIMGALAQKYGRKLVCDIDDSIWDIRKDNASYDIFKKGSESRDVVTAILKDVSSVTCTNNYLKNVVLRNCNLTPDKVQVFPNYIDLKFYNHIAKPKNTHTINIGHFGSTSHFANIVSGEFLKALSKIMSEYPNVTFTTIGSFFGGFKEKWGARYTQAYGDTDVVKWVKYKFPPFADDIDFFVTPVEDNIYNLSKSATKFNEASSTKRPGVWQNIRQYREVVKDGETGFLCTHEHEWYSAMKKLIDSAELRSKIGSAAYEWVKDNMQARDHVKEYADFFKKVLTSKK